MTVEQIKSYSKLFADTGQSLAIAYKETFTAFVRVGVKEDRAHQVAMAVTLHMFDFLWSGSKDKPLTDQELFAVLARGEGKGQ